MKATNILSNNIPSNISKASRRALVYSNLVYLLPVIVLLYKYFGQKSINISGLIILSVYYIAVMLYSINYHICQKYTNNIPDNFLLECPSKNMSYSQAKFNDLTLANFSLFLTILYIMPINNELRIILQSIGILWVITTQSFTNIFDNILYNSIPALVMSIFYFIYLVATFKHLHLVSQIISIFGCIFAIIAVTLFIFLRSNYGTTHTLWHIFGGLSGGMLLYPAVIGTDKFTWSGLFKLNRNQDTTLLDTKL